MQIIGVETEAYRIPPAIPWEDATNKVNALEFVVTEVRTDNGIVGTGFTYSVDIGATAIKSLIQDYLTSIVIGLDALHPELVSEQLERQSRRLGVGINSMAVAALDVALWDIVAKHHRMPLYKLLGGFRQSIPAYVSEINLSPFDTVEKFESRLATYIDRGYRALKLKGGREDVDEDIERIMIAKARLAHGGAVMLDLNQKWSSAEAPTKARKLDGLELAWLEEPCLYHDIEAHFRVRQVITTPIALGESFHARHQFLSFLKAGAVDVVQPDVLFVGGITEWLKIANLADSFGKLVAPHFNLELSLHLLCGIRNAYMLEDVVGGSFTELGLLDIPVFVEGGVGIPPDRPGHGVQFNRTALNQWRIDLDSLRSEFKGGSK